MKSYKGYTIAFILIIISFLLISMIKSFSPVLIDLKGGGYISLGKRIITLYNPNMEKMDTYVIRGGIKDFSLGDLDGTGSNGIVILAKRAFSQFGGRLMIFKLEDRIGRIYEEDFTQLKPWKVTAGDVDGDGKDEVSVGVYKKTPFHQVMDKRPFIYYFDGNRLEPKWRGSRLSKPFIDYEFCDLDGDGSDELVAIELLENGERVINTYKWKGFGFEGFLQSESYNDIGDLKSENGKIYVKIRNSMEELLGKLQIKNNILEIERVIIDE